MAAVAHFDLGFSGQDLSPRYLAAAMGCRRTANRGAATFYPPIRAWRPAPRSSCCIDPAVAHMQVSPRYAEFLPAVLLALVACAQLVLARTGDLTPWKGGGFGMFSTLDHGAFRRVTVVLDAPDRSEAIEN